MAPAGQNAPSSCLFLPELPSDLTDSSLMEMFGRYRGYVTSRTRHDRNGKLVGFIEFAEVEDAVRARDDQMSAPSPFPGLAWFVHYSNSKPSGPPSGGGPSSGGKRPREEPAAPVARHEAQRPHHGGMAPPPPVYRDDGRGGGYAPGPAPGQPPPHVMQHHTPPPGPYHGGHAPAPVPYYPPAPADPMTMQPQPVNYAALHLPPEASSTLYIEGLPSDASEREVAHIFRRYEGLGFQTIRMKGIESNKNPGTSLFLCFAEFDNAHQATVAMAGLQGYRFDTRVDKSEIRISYAKTKERSSASRPPAAAQRTPVNAPSAGADFRDSFPREHSGGARDGGREREWQGERERSPEDHRRYSDHDDDRRGRRSSGGNRRDGREHDDAYRDEYEDSERGDEDSMFHRADQTGMNFD